VGDRTNLLELTQLLKKYLSEFDPKIANVEIVHGPNRAGDIPHSLASVEKAQEFLGYKPSHRLGEGLKEAVGGYLESK
jgi:UDP-N-acetylglucosamine 4-epimerase